ncbi:hypothetical protein [Halobacteriovorax sp.]|uniref:hypothetical protein n=1 Tax=Halobacteriovorax sp. TaxID=2020862 RepID=UPI0035684646
MINYLLATFFILSLSFAGSLETVDCHDEVSGESISSSTVLSISVTHDHQREEGCKDKADHCIHHCSGIHNLLHFRSPVTFSDQEIRNIYLQWSYQHDYSEPHLDSAKKPPLFS